MSQQIDTKDRLNNPDHTHERNELAAQNAWVGASSTGQKIYTNVTPAQKIAVRTYFRLLARRTIGWEEWERCDAHFDGGEWSSGAWAEAWEEIEEKTMRDVATLFKIDYAALDRAIFIFINVENDCHMAAFFENENAA